MCIILWFITVIIIIRIIRLSASSVSSYLSVWQSAKPRRATKEGHASFMFRVEVCLPRWFRGDNLSKTTCLAQVFFTSGKPSSKLWWSLTQPNISKALKGNERGATGSQNLPAYCTSQLVSCRTALNWSSRWKDPGTWPYGQFSRSQLANFQIKGLKPQNHCWFMFTSKRPLKVQISQGLGPFFEIELLMTTGLIVAGFMYGFHHHFNNLHFWLNINGCPVPISSVFLVDTSYYACWHM